MDKLKLQKIIESILYESLSTQKQKYGSNFIDSIKDIDPTSTYKYVDQIQKFIHDDKANKDDVKQYIDIYNDKLSKNLIDKEHRDINQFKSFSDFKKYVDQVHSDQQKVGTRLKYKILHS